MIIKGKSRSGPGALAAHLGNAETNERVTLLEARGTVADDLRGALIELDAYAAGTRCQKSLYHAAISPEPPHRLSPEQRAVAIDALEDKLGLTGHARVVVIHEKKDREHIHVVWSRINLEKNRSVSDSHNYRKHEECSRDLERRFGHDRVQGAHVEREGVTRPDRTPSRGELRQEERTGVTGKQVKDEVTALFRSSDQASAFKSALEDRGYLLAKGDKRDFVIVDRAGGIHSLARRIDGVRAADLREYMKPIDREQLPSANVAHDAQIDKIQGRTSALDQRNWDEKLSQSAIDKDKQNDVAEKVEAKRFREEVIARETERKQRYEELERSRVEAHKEKSYGRGDDYVTQSTAAIKDHKERQEKLNNHNPRPSQPLDDDQKAKAHEELLRRQAEESTQRQEAQRAEAASTKNNFNHSAGETTDIKQSRLSRLLNAIDHDDHSNEREDPDPDRQRQAPGGGRTRGR